MRWLTVIEDDVPIISLNRWGPNGWKFIIACAFAYPFDPNLHERENMRIFLQSLEYVLPCHKCRLHYGENIRNMDDGALTSRITLLQWINTVRNKINVQESKPEVSFEQMISDCLTGCKHTSFFRITRRRLVHLMVLMILLLLVVLVFIV